jgi:hypothetical protein
LALFRGDRHRSRTEGRDRLEHSRPRRFRRRDHSRCNHLARPVPVDRSGCAEHRVPARPGNRQLIVGHHVGGWSSAKPLVASPHSSLCPPGLSLELMPAMLAGAGHAHRLIARSRGEVLRHFGHVTVAPSSHRSPVCDTGCPVCDTGCSGTAGASSGSVRPVVVGEAAKALGPSPTR